MLKALLILLAFQASLTSDQRCRAQEQRCELWCNEDTKGGTLSRLKCYERCREKETECRKYGSDGD
jgi:hypothetical protein